MKTTRSAATNMAKGYLLGLWTLAFWIPVYASSNPNGTREMISPLIKVIHDIQQDRFNDCILLFFDDDINLVTRLHIWKLASVHGLIVTINQCKDIEIRDMYSCRRKLFVIIVSGHNNSEPTIRNVLSTPHINASKVLILGNISSDWPVTLFDNKLIRFDWNVLVVELMREQQQTFHYQIFRIFRPSLEVSLKIRKYASWSQNNGLIINRKMNMPNLQGIILKVGLIEDPPFIFIHNVNDTLIYDGYYKAVLDLLADKINFRYNITNTSFEIWDKPVLIESEKKVSPIDLYAGAAGMVSSRIDYLSYVNILSTSKTLVFLSSPRFPRADFKSDLNVSFMEEDKFRSMFKFSTLYAPFETDLWLALIVSAILLIITEIIIVRYEPIRNYMSSFEFILHLPAAIFCNQSHPLSPVGNPSRIVVLCSYMIGMLALTTYSANIISQQAAGEPEPRYSELKDLWASEPKYSFGIRRKSTSYSIFENQRFGLFSDIFNSYLKSAANQPKSGSEVWYMLCSRDRWAFIGLIEELEIPARDRMPCFIRTLPKALYITYFSMAVSKDSQYLQIINFYVNRFRETGILQYLKKMTPFFLNAVLRSDDHRHFYSVGFREALPIILILVVGYAIAILILILEFATRLRIIRQ